MRPVEIIPGAVDFELVAGGSSLDVRCAAPGSLPSNAEFNIPLESRGCWFRVPLGRVFALALVPFEGLGSRGKPGPFEGLPALIYKTDQAEAPPILAHVVHDPFADVCHVEYD